MVLLQAPGLHARQVALFACRKPNSVSIERRPRPTNVPRPPQVRTVKYGTLELSPIELCRFQARPT